MNLGIKECLLVLPSVTRFEPNYLTKNSIKSLFIVKKSQKYHKRNDIGRIINDTISLESQVKKLDDPIVAISIYHLYHTHLTPRKKPHIQSSNSTTLHNIH